LGVPAFCTVVHTRSDPHLPSNIAFSFSPLESVTFEPGSKLREIESGGFCGCELLKEICIPASVTKLNAASFPRSRNGQIEIEHGNEHFAMSGDFLTTFDGHWIIRYCGTGSELAIGDEIETICEYCFAFSSSIVFVSFGPLSKLSSIEIRAFWMCSELKTISIPASVTFLGNHCFDGSTSLRAIVFLRWFQIGFHPVSCVFRVLWTGIDSASLVCQTTGNWLFLFMLETYEFVRLPRLTGLFFIHSAVID
jgi:hypothetical protein